MLNIIYIFISFIINKPGLIFFTGGSNAMPLRLYSQFTNTLSNNFEIYKFDFNSNYKNNILNLSNKHKKIIMLGHSSGCVTAINNCDQYIDNLILMDPVKTFSFRKKDITKLNKILILQADLSYKWKDEFPYIPFIPFLKITKDDLNINNDKIKIKNIKNYGHSDLIDNPWRDFMHNIRVSTGNSNRSNFTMQIYYNTLTKIITTL